jgi:hypothetical protein
MKRFSSSLDKIEKIFSRHSIPPTSIELTNTENAIIIDRCNELAKRYSKNVSDKRWDSYSEFGCHLTSNRYIKNRKPFIGSVILINMTFFYDDLKEDNIDQREHEKIIFEEFSDVCRTYYSSQEESSNVFRVAKQWVNHDSYFRNNPSKYVLCKNIHTYWEYRLIDSAISYWLACASPAYQNPELSKLIDLMILPILCLKPFIIVNDICSYPKEKASGEAANFLNQDVIY